METHDQLIIATGGKDKVNTHPSVLSQLGRIRSEIARALIVCLSLVSPALPTTVRAQKKTTLEDLQKWVREGRDPPDMRCRKCDHSDCLDRECTPADKERFLKELRANEPHLKRKALAAMDRILPFAEEIYQSPTDEIAFWRKDFLMRFCSVIDTIDAYARLKQFGIPLDVDMSDLGISSMSSFCDGVKKTSFNADVLHPDYSVSLCVGLEDFAISRRADPDLTIFLIGMKSIIALTNNKAEACSRRGEPGCNPRVTESELMEYWYNNPYFMSPLSVAYYRKGDIKTAYEIFQASETAFVAQGSSVAEFRSWQYKGGGLGYASAIREYESNQGKKTEQSARTSSTARAWIKTLTFFAVFAGVAYALGVMPEGSTLSAPVPRGPAAPPVSPSIDRDSPADLERERENTRRRCIATCLKDYSGCLGIVSRKRGEARVQFADFCEGTKAKCNADCLY